MRQRAGLPEAAAGGVACLAAQATRPAAGHACLDDWGPLLTLGGRKAAERLGVREAGPRSGAPAAAELTVQLLRRVRHQKACRQGGGYAAAALRCCPPGRHFMSASVCVGCVAWPPVQYSSGAFWGHDQLPQACRRFMCPAFVCANANQPAPLPHRGAELSSKQVRLI